MKEYGSNTQHLVDHIVSIADKDERTKKAFILVELMRQIHPQMRDGLDYSKKLWDDLYIMANFDLDVDSPFPPPPKEILGRKPSIVPYNQHKIKHLYYGRNLELMVAKIVATEDEGERKAFISYLVKMMKGFFLTWNKDTTETNSCLQVILELSEFKLQAEIDYLRENGIIEDAAPHDGNSNISSRGANNQSSSSNNRKSNNYRKKNTNNTKRFSKDNRRRR
ncbi:MAG: DUF4290 domain-containing protein [Spirosomaceae bacterium]|nr:DUF4290 domain-containing protein [Spirosomataceae bacterium]